MFNFFSEIKKNTKIPNDELFASFQMIDIGGKLLYVEGHCGLLTLTKEEIAFKVKGGYVVVSGNDMFLDELCDATLKICGKIKKVERF